MASQAAMFPAVTSSLSISDVLILFEETKNKHAQRDATIVDTYVDLLMFILINIRANHNSVWVAQLDNAVSSLVVIKHRLVSDQASDQVVSCLTTTIALSLLVKRAETNDVMRRNCAEIVNSPMFPFIVPENLKQFVTIFIASSNLFWVAFDQIRAFSGAAAFMGTIVRDGLEELVSTKRMHCIWLSNMLVQDTSTRKRSLVLSDCVVFTEVDTDSGSTSFDATTTIMR